MTLTEKHYDDAMLAALAARPEDCVDDPHLAVCPTCSESLETLRILSEAGADETVWSAAPIDDEPSSETITKLRAAADAMNTEDVAAEPLVAALLASPSATWTNAHTRAELRTAGVVRKLIEATDKLNDSAPADVVALTALATRIAAALPATTPNNDLHAAAWREHAYALHYVGRHNDALKAADRAAQLPTNEFNKARLDLVRALILRSLERLDEAVRVAVGTVPTFRSHGDAYRANFAAGIAGMVAFSARDFRTAAETFERLLHTPDYVKDDRVRATTLQTLAACYRELGEHETALRYYGAAVRIFDEQGMEAERTRATWFAGRMLLDQGRHKESVVVLRAVKDSYRGLQMTEKVALVALDLAEALLLTGRGVEVQDLCREAIQFYATSGLAHTRGAITALSLLREAAQSGELTQVAVRQVRDYLERLPQQPQLLFAYAPGEIVG